MSIVRNAGEVLLNRDFFIQAILRTPAEFETKPSHSQVLTNKKRVQCYCLSDIHFDVVQNKTWCQSYIKPLLADDEAFSIFIVAGDIATGLDAIRDFFRMVIPCYDAVCFLPGNHEAWTTVGKGSDVKVMEILSLAVSLGVFVGPLSVRMNSGRSVVVVPLYSWYHGTWDTEPDVDHPKLTEMRGLKPFSCGDFGCCAWPVEWLSREEFVANRSTFLAEVFAKMNEPFLFPPPDSPEDLESDVQYLGTPLAGRDDTIISFSHFVPRIELVPEKRLLVDPDLMKVVGSDMLKWQVARLQPALHVFGHTHIPIDLELDGIRYIQWPLGGKREAAKKECKIVVETGPLLVYDTALGDGKDGIPADVRSLQAECSQHYRTTPRNPNNVTEIAPWVEKEYDRVIRTFGK